MRMMLKVTIPAETGSKSIKEGVLGQTMMRFVETMKPEASYFLPQGGKRAAIFFFDLKDPSMIPTTVEPFFMNLHAEIELTPAMNLEDMKSGVEKAMKNV